MWGAGASEILGNNSEAETEFMTQLVGTIPLLNPPETESTRFAQMAVLALNIATSTAEKWPEGVVMGAWNVVQMCCYVNVGVGRIVYEAGYVELSQKVLSSFTPIERISRDNLLATVVAYCTKDVLASSRTAGLDVTGAMFQAAEMAMSNLIAYHMLGRPGDASVAAVWFGSLVMLDECNLSSPEAGPIVQRIRETGAEAFRYVLGARFRLLIPTLVCLTCP